MSRNSTRDELFSGSASSTSTSLLRLAGGWGNVGGPGLFMIRSVTSGALTSVFIGMTGGIISGMIYGTAALPFLVCSCVGFIVGTVGFYRDTLRKSMLYLDRYPRLVQLHLDANFPAERFDLWPRERMHSSHFRGWRLHSMLTVGWLSAMPAIESAIDLQENRLIEEEAAAETAAVEAEEEK